MNSCKICAMTWQVVFYDVINTSLLVCILFDIIGHIFVKTKCWWQTIQYSILPVTVCLFYWLISKMCIAYSLQGTWGSSVAFALSFFETPPGQQLGREVEHTNEWWITIKHPGVLWNLPISLEALPWVNVTPASRTNKLKTLSVVSSGADTADWRPVMRLFFASVCKQNKISITCSAKVNDRGIWVIQLLVLMISTQEPYFAINCCWYATCDINTC